MKKEKLYRKDNKKSLSTLYYTSKGGKYKWKRSKVNRDLDYPMRDPMKSKRLGRDYTPLFRFLISKVGQKWDEIYSEAVSRLDTPEPIWWLVKTNDSYKDRGDPTIVRVGQHTHYPRLYVDENGVLQYCKEE